MHFRQSLAAPVAWGGRALLRNGPERAAVLQILKAALAAVIAWVVAADVLALPQPFLAPYAAVFVVEATVYRSVRYAAQQFGAMVGAVTVAAAVGHLIPSLTLALAVAVAAGLLLGQWRRLGDAGPWVGITALVIVTYGQATHEALLLARLAEGALGVAIGTVVNAALFPPVYADGARRATERLAAEMAELIAAMANGLRHNDIAGPAGEWVRRSYDLTGLVTEAEQAVSWSRESRRLNIRGGCRDGAHRPVTTGSPWPGSGRGAVPADHGGRAARGRRDRAVHARAHRRVA
ncbi:aromatic acid exporter family protein [Prauserella oleivorans]